MERDKIAHRIADCTRLVCCFLISTAATIVLSRIKGGSNPTEQIESRLGALFPIIALLIAPLWETVIFQSLPSFLGDTFSWRTRTVWVATILPFALAHVDPNYYLLGLTNGLIGGTALAYAYIFYKRYSHFIAFLITLFLHIIHNALFVLTDFH